MSKVFVNDSFYSQNEAKISVFDRGFIYGDSVYEVVLIYNGKLCFVQEHADRMVNSLKMSYIKGFDSKKISSLFHNIHEANKDIKLGFLYLQISRGIQFTRYEKLDENKHTIVGYVEAISPSDFYKNKDCGISCAVIKDPRRLKRNLKSNSLISMVIARHEANMAGFDDIIYENIVGHITESSTSNVFIVNKDDSILTHPLGIEKLPGTMRAFLLQNMKKQGFNIREDFFKKDDLYNAKEVFITGSVKLIVPVVKIDDQIIGSGKIGEITKKFRSELIDYVSR